MMKNFTKIILGLFALATSTTANAMEWRVVESTDFGGNSTDDPAICKTRPTEVETDLLWYDWASLYQAGNFMVIKATQLATVGTKNGIEYNLTNWGTNPSASGMPKWAKGGDHTHPDDPNIGYYMAFDCPNTGSDLKLYKKVLPITCTGVKFRLEAYFGALADDLAANKVTVSIIGGDKVLDKSSASLEPATDKILKWTQLSAEFTVDDPNINSVDFLVEANECMSTGWDIAMDDITISVNQPSLSITAGEFYYHEPATLTAEYSQEEFNAFFGSSFSDVVYQWYKQDESTGTFSAIGSLKSYTSGSDISYTIPAFEKETDNGTYRLIVATKDNLNSKLCSIQKDYVINQEKNQQLVKVCKDSTKTMPDGTVLSTVKYDDQDVLSNNGSMLYIVKCIKFDTLPGKYINQCKNIDFPEVKNYPQDPIITYYEDDSKCPKTIQKQTIVVKGDYVEDEPKHLCEGNNYNPGSTVEKIWSTVDETEGKMITFEEDGCTHSQYVFVHPNKETENVIDMCEGDEYEDVPYNIGGKVYKGNSTKLKTIYGCDSIVIDMLNVKKKTYVDLGAPIYCPSDNYEFGGKVWNFPVDTTLSYTCEGSNGCDSITTIHLEVKDGGVINRDTLICRDQILFGEEFLVPEEVTRVRSGFTESGCPIDTVWKITVVEISLNLRLFNNQTEVCEGQPAAMTAKLKTSSYQGKQLEPTYYWEPEIPTNVLDPTLYLNETTTYSIYADLDLPAAVDPLTKGCHAKASVTIKVNPMPELVIDTVNPDDRSVEYTVLGGTSPYHLYLGSKNGQKDLGLITDNYGSNDHLPYGTHILQVQDSTGCSAEQTISIEAVQPEPDMYFSPNHDAVNDLWTVKNLDSYPTATIRIFDRYGKLLYDGVGETFIGWDGTYNGNDMPATDYWYEIDIDEIDKTYFGHFTLIR